MPPPRPHIHPRQQRHHRRPPRAVPLLHAQPPPVPVPPLPFLPQLVQIARAQLRRPRLFTLHLGLRFRFRLCIPIPPRSVPPPTPSPRPLRIRSQPRRAARVEPKPRRRPPQPPPQEPDIVRHHARRGALRHDADVRRAERGEGRGRRVERGEEGGRCLLSPLPLHRHPLPRPPVLLLLHQPHRCAHRRTGPKKDWDGTRATRQQAARAPAPRGDTARSQRAPRAGCSRAGARGRQGGTRGSASSWGRWPWRWGGWNGARAHGAPPG
ncbi:hypothetical protein B0H14DRAFT_1648278 [Mycena olivaceomarginata]|nr:hypothetical protein B0H14DRAFT_1648278 [Mycena olivaceomarginata]